MSLALDSSTSNGGIRPRVFVSWSGGKDSCLACYRAAGNNLEVRYLANMITEDGERSRSHGQRSEILRLQARAIGIPLLQRRTDRTSYETEFRNMMVALREDGVEGGVFGDIDFNEHRQWLERVCRAVGATPYFPLWEEPQPKLMRDFVDLGFEAVVVAARADYFSEEILGQKVDRDFIRRLEELQKTREVTLCGEKGEYHTLVIDGPLFSKRLEIFKTRKIFREGNWILEVLEADIRDRGKDISPERD